MPPSAMKHGTDTIMTVTAFGMFVYSTFTIIAGRDSVTIPSFDGCHETHSTYDKGVPVLSDAMF